MLLYPHIFIWFFDIYIYIYIYTLAQANVFIWHFYIYLDDNLGTASRHSFHLLLYWLFFSYIDVKTVEIFGTF